MKKLEIIAKPNEKKATINMSDNDLFAFNKDNKLSLKKDISENDINSVFETLRQNNIPFSFKAEKV